MLSGRLSIPIIIGRANPPGIIFVIPLRIANIKSLGYASKSILKNLVIRSNQFNQCYPCLNGQPGRRVSIIRIFKYLQKEKNP